MINLTEIFIVSTFIENFEKYKKLKNSGYKPHKYLELAEVSVLFFAIVTTMALSIIYQFTFLIFVSISFFVLMLSYPLTLALIGSEGFFVSKYDEIYKIKKVLNEKVFSGSLFEIFDNDCEITNKVLKEYKESLNSHIYLYKGIKGCVIIEMWDKIIKEKEKAEEIETMKECNTKTGKMFKEVEGL